MMVLLHYIDEYVFDIYKLSPHTFFAITVININKVNGWHDRIYGL